MGKSIAWTEQAKAHLRPIDQATALRILHALARYLSSGEGDIKRLQDVEPLSFVSALAATASAFAISAIPSSFWPSSTVAKPIADRTTDKLDRMTMDVARMNGEPRIRAITPLRDESAFLAFSSLRSLRLCVLLRTSRTFSRRSPPHQVSCRRQISRGAA